jgi:signal transduction histidine kinase
VLGKHVNILLPERDSAGLDLTGLVQEIVEYPDNFINNINENILCNGLRIWMAWTNKPIYNEDGNLVEILAAGTDITALKDAELAWAKSENEKKLILDNTDELIAYHDRENNLIWGNRVYLEAAGKTLSQIKGRKCFDCWGLEKICTSCPVTRAIETGSPHNNILTPQNQTHWPEDQGCWDVRAVPVKDDDGNIIGAIEVGREITERIKTEETLRALASFPEENTNPVMRCSLEGDILYSNDPAKSWLKSLGYKTGEPFPVSVHNLLKSVREKARKMETEIISGSGQIFNIIAVQPPNENYINLYGTDITERKKAERALKKAHDNLDQKVKERTAELEWRNRELNEFAFVASHDLQEPLRKIKLFGEMTGQELSGALNDKGKDYLQRMIGAADRMQKLVRALLAYSRTSSKEGPFERVNLKAMADEIIDNLMPEYNEAAPVIEVGDLPEIDADPVQMQQLFQNLIANAVHYHREGQAPKVNISSRILERDDREKRKLCELTVEDNGIGFDMSYVNKIFLPFERLDEQNKYAGTGMGLAICRKIVERHMGQIMAHSIPGEGATFIVTLPVRQIIESG